MLQGYNFFFPKSFSSGFGKRKIWTSMPLRIEALFCKGERRKELLGLMLCIHSIYESLLNFVIIT